MMKMMIGICLLATSIGCHATSVARGHDRVALSHTLPPLDGARVTVQLVEVTYAPGESSRPHTHPCPVVGYVVDGAVRMKLAGRPEVVYRTGDTFYESPSDIHEVSANASADRPATFVAMFTCDHDGPLAIAAHEHTH